MDPDTLAHECGHATDGDPDLDPAPPPPAADLVLVLIPLPARPFAVTHVAIRPIGRSPPPLALFPRVPPVDHFLQGHAGPGHLVVPAAALPCPPASREAALRGLGVAGGREGGGRCQELLLLGQRLRKERQRTGSSRPAQGGGQRQE
jgi:hypothetical protein